MTSGFGTTSDGPLVFLGGRLLFGVMNGFGPSLPQGRSRQYDSPRSTTTTTTTTTSSYVVVVVVLIVVVGGDGGSGFVNYFGPF